MTAPGKDSGGSAALPVRPPSGDRGVAKVLEAIVIATLVLGAIGYALGSHTPQEASRSQPGQDLEATSWDALEALDEMWYPNASHGNSMLSYLVSEAANGDPDPLREGLGVFMPPGSQFQVHLSNGEDRRTLYEDRSPTGATEGISYPFEPSWKAHYGSTDLEVHDSATTNMTMGHTLIPVFNSNPVHDPGLRVQASAHGNLTWVPGFADEQAPDAADPYPAFNESAYTSFIQGDDSQSLPSASIHLQCERDAQLVPCYAMDLTTNVRDGYAPKDQRVEDGDVTASKLGIAVENEGPGVLPAGTTLRVSLPVGLELDGDIEDGGGDVAFDVQNTLDEHGSAPQPVTVTVDLSEDLGSNGTAILDVWVTRTDDRYAYKNVHATLEDGASSNSQFLLVVEDKPSLAYTDGDARDVLVSAPRPAGSGQSPEGRWAIVLPTPLGTTNVTRAALSLAEDGSSFEAASYPEDFDPPHPSTPVTTGDLAVQPDRIEWNHSDLQRDAYSFLELQLNVTTDGTSVPASPTFPPALPEASFQAFGPPPHMIQQDPGLWWTQHAPNQLGTPGYPIEEAATTQATQELDHRNVPLEGTTNYTVAPFRTATDPPPRDTAHPALAEAIQASTLEADAYEVAPGEPVELTVNATPVLRVINESIDLDTATATTSILSAESMAEFTPAHEYDHAISSQGDPHLDPDAIEHTVPGHALYGVQIVVTELTWSTTDANGDPVDQTARLHETFRVVPTSGSTSISPTYTLDLIAWMEDE